MAAMKLTARLVSPQVGVRVGLFAHLSPSSLDPWPSPTTANPNALFFQPLAFLHLCEQIIARLKALVERYGSSPHLEVQARSAGAETNGWQLPYDFKGNISVIVL